MFPQIAATPLNEAFEREGGMIVEVFRRDDDGSDAIEAKRAEVAAQATPGEDGEGAPGGRDRQRLDGALADGTAGLRRIADEAHALLVDGSNGATEPRSVEYGGRRIVGRKRRAKGLFQGRLC